MFHPSVGCAVRRINHTWRAIQRRVSHLAAIPPWMFLNRPEERSSRAPGCHDTHGEPPSTKVSHAFLFSPKYVLISNGIFTAAEDVKRRRWARLCLSLLMPWNVIFSIMLNSDVSFNGKNHALICLSLSVLKAKASEEAHLRCEIDLPRISQIPGS